MSVNDNITKEKCDHMKMQFSVFLAFFSLGRFSHSLAGVTRSSSFESVRKITGYREYSKPNIFYKKKLVFRCLFVMEVSLVSQHQQFGCIDFSTTEICSFGTLSLISFLLLIHVVRINSSLTATANHKSIRTEK